SDATVDDAAADLLRDLARRLRIVVPQRATAAGIKGVYRTPGRGDVDDTVDVQRRALLRQVHVIVGIPGKAKAVDVAGVDFVEGAVVRFLVGSPDHRPLRGLAGSVAQALVRDPGSVDRDRSTGRCAGRLAGRRLCRRGRLLT